MGTDDLRVWPTNATNGLRGNGDGVTTTFQTHDNNNADYNCRPRANPFDLGAYWSNGENTNPGWVIAAGELKDMSKCPPPIPTTPPPPPSNTTNNNADNRSCCRTNIYIAYSTRQSRCHFNNSFFNKNSLWHNPFWSANICQQHFSMYNW